MCPIVTRVHVVIFIQLTRWWGWEGVTDLDQSSSIQLDDSEQSANVSVFWGRSFQNIHSHQIYSWSSLVLTRSRGWIYLVYLYFGKVFFLPLPFFSPSLPCHVKTVGVLRSWETPANHPAALKDASETEPSLMTQRLYSILLNIVRDRIILAGFPTSPMTKCGLKRQELTDIT